MKRVPSAPFSDMSPNVAEAATCVQVSSSTTIGPGADHSYSHYKARRITIPHVLPTPSPYRPYSIHLASWYKNGWNMRNPL